MKYHVLIADDESDMRQILALHLSKQGYTTFEAMDGQEALELIIQHEIHLVVSDFVMPRIDGLSLLARLVKMGSRIPFILVTGFGNEDYAKKALKLGAFDFIEKPFKLEALNHLVGRALGAEKPGPQVLPLDLRTFQIFESRLAKAIAAIEPKMLAKTPNTQSEFRFDFIQSAWDQLALCQGSLARLNDMEQRESELGHLFRVVREVGERAKGAALLDIANFASLCTEILVYYRLQAKELEEEQIALICESVALLSERIKEILDEDNSSYKMLQIEDRLRDLYNQIFQEEADENSVENIDKAS